MHFALVHGAYHGAWCWDRLRRELEHDGHTSSAADLPCDDPEAGAARYADVVLRAIPGGAGGLVLVGHSLGGLTIPIVAARAPAVACVYLCALVPEPGKSFDGQHVNVGSHFTPSEAPVAHPDGSASWPERGAIEVFYHDCDPELGRDAARRLRRQHWRITEEVTPLRQWPDAQTTYILCTEDRVVSVAYARDAAARLGVEPNELPGGHSPFLSRPRQLADLLGRLFVATAR
jgi:pimeloyl-ACP methyl ester carboxylesterase